jgi:hypothetical protein
LKTLSLKLVLYFDRKAITMSWTLVMGK